MSAKDKSHHNACRLLRTDLLVSSYSSRPTAVGPRQDTPSFHFDLGGVAMVLMLRWRRDDMTKKNQDTKNIKLRKTSRYLVCGGLLFVWFFGPKCSLGHGDRSLTRQ